MYIDGIKYKIASYFLVLTKFYLGVWIKTWLIWSIKKKHLHLQILKIVTRKQTRSVEIQEEIKAQNLDPNTKKKFGKGADAILQALLGELSAPVYNNNNRYYNQIHEQ